MFIATRNFIGSINNSEVPIIKKEKLVFFNLFPGEK